MTCIDNPSEFYDEDEEPMRLNVSPFECTHYYMRHGPTTDHAHEFTRHWSMDALKGQELLESCAEVYDRLDQLVDRAHELLGASMPEYKAQGSRRRLPCMEDLSKYRVVRTTVKDGIESWENEPPGLHQH